MRSGEGSTGLASCRRLGRAEDGWQQCLERDGGPGPRGAQVPHLAKGRADAERKRSTTPTAEEAGQSRGRAEPIRSARTPTRSNWRAWRSKRALLKAAGEKADRNGVHPGLTTSMRNAAKTSGGKGMYIDAEWDPTVPHGNDRLSGASKLRTAWAPTARQ